MSIINDSTKGPFLKAVGAGFAPSQWEEVSFWVCGGEASGVHKTEEMSTHQ